MPHARHRSSLPGTLLLACASLCFTAAHAQTPTTALPTSAATSIAAPARDARAPSPPTIPASQVGTLPLDHQVRWLSAPRAAACSRACPTRNSSRSSSRSIRSRCRIPEARTERLPVVRVHAAAARAHPRHVADRPDHMLVRLHARPAADLREVAARRRARRPGTDLRRFETRRPDLRTSGRPARRGADVGVAATVRSRGRSRIIRCAISASNTSRSSFWRKARNSLTPASRARAESK